MESQYNNLLFCPRDLRSLYFPECINNTLSEYCVRTDNKKLLLILDGIDEVSNIEELCSFIPASDYLDEDVYILITCRTKDEIEKNRLLAEFIDNTIFESHMNFTRGTVTITQKEKNKIQIENAEYYDAFEQYAEAILCEQGGKINNINKQKLAESFEYRFSSISAYRKLCRISPVFRDRFVSDLFNVFMQQIEVNAPDTYIKQLKKILNTLVCAGEPITLRELAFLSGERYISYRLLGMMNDIGAFVKITRSSRGNCYELSHAQWEEAVRVLIPYGDIHFRKQCNELIAEMEMFFNEDNISLILEKNYEGELWLLKHILGIYNHNWKELKENWFEEIRIASVEDVIILLLQDQSFINNVGQSYCDKQDVSLKSLLQIIARDYFEALSHFDYDKAGIRGYRNYKKKGNVSLIRNLFENVYSNIYHNKKQDFLQSDVFDLSYDAAKLLSEYQAILSNDEVARVRNIILKHLYHAKTNSEYHEDGIEYLEVLFMIADLRKKGEKYKEAKENLIEIITLLRNAPSSNTQEAIILARSYAVLGTVYYYEKNNSELHMYLEANSILSRISNLISGEEYLKLRIWVLHLIGDTYNEQNKQDEAIKYWKQALAFSELLSKDSIAYKLNKLNKKIGEALLAEKKLSEAREYFECAYAICCEYDFDKIDILKDLITVFELMEDEQKVMQYKTIYQPLIEEKQKYADAYQEVLEILNHTEKGAKEKIPASTINMMMRLQNPNYGFRYDPSKSLDEQHVTKTARTILAIWFRDYWANDGQRDRIQEHEKRERIEYRFNIAQELSQFINPDIKNLETNSIKYSQACSEVFWILQYIPQNITRRIPVEIIMSIKSSRDMQYPINFNISGKNVYLQKTLEVFSFLINNYIPNYMDLLNEYREQIPEDFDLYEIFDE